MLQIWLRTFQLAGKNLWMHPLRSSLTVLGIFIGVSSVIWLLAIGEGIGRAAQEQIASLGATNIIVRTVKPAADEVQDAGYGLTRDDYARLLDTVPTIQKAIPIRALPAQFSYDTRTMQGRLVASTPDYAEVASLALDHGRFLTQADLDSERNYCVLAAETAAQLFPFGEPVGKSIRVDDLVYEVVGVMKPRSPTAGVGGSFAAEDFNNDIYIPITTMLRWLGDMVIVAKPGQFQRDIYELSQITIQVGRQEDVISTADVVKNTIDDFHLLPDFAVTVPLELLRQAETTRLMFILFLGLIAAISLVVGGIGIMNIMLATVVERTREVGIRRALGAKRRDIVRQFLTECVVLSVVGGTLGILGGFLCGPLIRLARFGMEQFFAAQWNVLPDLIKNIQPILIPWSIPLAFLISVFVGVVFGVYPASRAAALDPIEALRHE
jgi:putative ABC transport system permease protein